MSPRLLLWVDLSKSELMAEGKERLEPELRRSLICCGYALRGVEYCKGMMMKEGDNGP